MEIRQSLETDLNDILNIHQLAFGIDKGPEIADLVHGLLHDPTAMPMLSLIATEADNALGHILFTKAQIPDSDTSISAAILAPLAVIPDAQSKGVGGQLINLGLKISKASGTDLVFVLGHPGYYPRHGFTPAGALGFEAPYYIPPEHADAWMTQQLRPGFIGTIKGKIRCANTLNQPQHWRE